MAFDYDVFLSHHADDRPVAQDLAQRLQSDGLTVTWDETHLEQARCFIACMSPAYFASTWPTLEHQTRLFRDPTNLQRADPGITGEDPQFYWRSSAQDFHRSIFLGHIAFSPEFPDQVTTIALDPFYWRQGGVTKSG